jgi:UPF0755 protein
VKINGWKLGVSILASIFLTVAAAVFLFERAITAPMNTDDAGYRVVLKPGATMDFVARELSKNGVIPIPQPLIWYARLKGLAHRIQAGEYWIPPGMTPVDLVEALVSGRVIQHPVTFIEGWTFREVLAVLAAQPQLQSKISGMSYQQIMAAIGMEGISPEGRFFPDTYLYVAGTTDLDLLMRSATRMQQFLQNAWVSRDAGLPYADVDEALVMASIIEKETGSEGERNKIAGVFVRRLQLGMRLQSDPTVIFGMGDNYKGNITRADLKRLTAYNTYRIKGLPPTPIAMPGEASIEAALHPSEGSELYFVGKGDGSHHFSDTLAQHRQAVEKYQRSGRKKDYRSRPTKSVH